MDMKMKTYMETYTFDVTYVKPGTFNKLEHGTIEIKSETLPSHDDIVKACKDKYPTAYTYRLLLKD